MDYNPSCAFVDYMNLIELSSTERTTHNPKGFARALQSARQLLGAVPQKALPHQPAVLVEHLLSTITFRRETVCEQIRAGGIQPRWLLADGFLRDCLVDVQDLCLGLSLIPPLPPHEGSGKGAQK